MNSTLTLAREKTSFWLRSSEVYMPFYCMRAHLTFFLFSFLFLNCCFNRDWKRILDSVSSLSPYGLFNKKQECDAPWCVQAPITSSSCGCVCVKTRSSSPQVVSCLLSDKIQTVINVEPSALLRHYLVCAEASVLFLLRKSLFGWKHLLNVNVSKGKRHQ